MMIKKFSAQNYSKSRTFAKDYGFLFLIRVPFFFPKGSYGLSSGLLPGSF